MTNWVEIDRLAKLWVKEAGSRIKASMQEGLSIETKSNPNDLVTTSIKKQNVSSLKRYSRHFQIIIF